MERDDNGEPTGILKEPMAQALVSEHVPLLTRDEKKTALLTALSHLNANGVNLAKTRLRIGPWLDFDPETETFVDNAQAQAHLQRP